MIKITFLDTARSITPIIWALMGIPYLRNAYADGKLLISILLLNLISGAVAYGVYVFVNGLEIKHKEV